MGKKKLTYDKHEVKLNITVARESGRAYTFQDKLNNELNDTIFDLMLNEVFAPGANPIDVLVKYLLSGKLNGNMLVGLASLHLQTVGDRAIQMKSMQEAMAKAQDSEGVNPLDNIQTVDEGPIASE